MFCCGTPKKSPTCRTRCVQASKVRGAVAQRSAAAAGWRQRRGPPGRQGARTPRDPSPLAPPRTRLPARAAHVFLFCVVAFVLQARIYILSGSGEWVGALLRAGEEKEKRIKKKKQPTLRLHLLVALLPFFFSFFVLFLFLSGLFIAPSR